MSSLPPGWYKDPADTSTQRYWDGEGWVGEAIPADAVPPDGPPPSEAPPVARPVSPGIPVAGEPAPGMPMPSAWAPPPAQSWGQPPPGWTPPPGFPMSLPYPVQARPHGFALAGLGPRFMARILDIIAVLLLNVVVNGYFAYQFALELAPIWQAAMADPFGPQPQATPRAAQLMWIMLIVATLLWLLYEAPATGARGQTLGKRIMHIKVVGVESTEPLGFARAFRRWAPLGLWTPFWGCCIGVLFQLVDSASPLFDPRLRQAIHDRSARTVVVALPPNDRQPVGTSSGGHPGNPPGGHS